MSPRSALRRAAAFAGVLIALAAIGYLIVRPAAELPILLPGGNGLRPASRAALAQGRDHRIADFRLIDQRGDTITLAALRGRILVADFFFTACTGICPKMAGSLRRVQDAYPGDPRLAILSHSVMPEADSVPVLAAYADLHGADPGQWHFLTGDRPEILALARKSYCASHDEGDGGPDDLVHTESLVLVDAQRRIRGIYGGTNPKEADRLIADIGKLMREEPRP